MIKYSYFFLSFHLNYNTVYVTVYFLKYHPAACLTECKMLPASVLNTPPLFFFFHDKEKSVVVVLQEHCQSPVKEKYTSI